MAAIASPSKKASAAATGAGAWAATAAAIPAARAATTTPSRRRPWRRSPRSMRRPRHTAVAAPVSVYTAASRPPRAKEPRARPASTSPKIAMVIGRRAQVEATNSRRHGGYERNERYDGIDDLGGLGADDPGRGRGTMPTTTRTDPMRSAAGAEASGGWRCHATRATVRFTPLVGCAAEHKEA